MDVLLVLAVKELLVFEMLVFFIAKQSVGIDFVCVVSVVCD